MNNPVMIQEDTMDRIMVLDRIANKIMTRTQGAQKLELSVRQVDRLLKRYKEEGMRGVAPKKRSGRPPLLKEVKDEIALLYKQRYPDFSFQHACEKLEELHSIKLSRESLRQLLILDGFKKSKPKKKAHIHQSRPRRERFGELVQMDGSFHDWFEGRADKCCLIVMIDDATGKLLSLKFEERETTFGYMLAIKDHLLEYGRPVAYYSDKHSIFTTTRHEHKDNAWKQTQLHAALDKLKIELICAHSPQAKGRVERANQTLQDRLVKEMRLKNISSIEEANAYLKEFIQIYNKKFSVAPTLPQDAHSPLLYTPEKLEMILAKFSTRKVSKNLEFSFDGHIYQIQNMGKGHRLRQGEITICQTMNHETKVIYNGELLEYKVLHQDRKPKVADFKDINFQVDCLIEAQKKRA